jgi:hypothetical protein
MRDKQLFFLIATLPLLLSACNYPGWSTPAASGSELLYTAAAQTLEAQLTQVSQPLPTQAFVTLPPAALPSPVLPSPTLALPTLAPTAAPTKAAATPTPRPCDQAEFVKDVTYPDNSQVAAGETFVKTWRLRNSGTCSWNNSYALVFAGGDALGAPASVQLAGNVAPGETIDLSVTLTAPAEGGTFKADFKLRNPSNVVFGLGAGNKPFWAQVKVPVKSGILVDFIASADEAAWFNNPNTGEAGAALTFGGADDDPAGVAKIKDGVKLETGAVSGKILLTYPRQVDNGVILGIFPAYAVQRGDVFKARLGFLIPDGASGCGGGKVKFQLLYQEGSGGFNLLKEWGKSCDEKFVPVEVDLSGLRGKTVKFILAVLADGAATDDWAIWNSPRIER